MFVCLRDLPLCFDHSETDERKEEVEESPKSTQSYSVSLLQRKCVLNVFGFCD